MANGATDPTIRTVDEVQKLRKSGEVDRADVASAQRMWLREESPQAYEAMLKYQQEQWDERQRRAKQLEEIRSGNYSG